MINQPKLGESRLKVAKKHRIGQKTALDTKPAGNGRNPVKPSQTVT